MPGRHASPMRSNFELHAMSQIITFLKVERCSHIVNSLGTTGSAMELPDSGAASAAPIGARTQTIVLSMVMSKLLLSVEYVEMAPAPTTPLYL